MYVARGAESGVTAGDPVAGELPRRRQGEKPHPGQPVRLAGGEGRRSAAGAQGAVPGAGSGPTKALEITRSLPHGQVAAVLGSAARCYLYERLSGMPVSAARPQTTDHSPTRRQARGNFGLAGHTPRECANDP